MKAVVQWLQGLGCTVAAVDDVDPIVWLEVPPASLLAEADRLVRELRSRGIDVVPVGRPGVTVDGGYCPVTGDSTIQIYGVDDAHLADPALLRPVELSVTIEGERYLVVGRYRPEPQRLDVYGAIRVDDGEALEPADFLALAVPSAVDAIHEAARAAWIA